MHRLDSKRLYVKQTITKKKKKHPKPETNKQINVR